MAVNYTIKADIIDLSVDTPQETDVFLVDTNVWFWMSYPAANVSAIPYQLDNYPLYVQNVLKKDAKIYRTGLSLAEISHRIEKTQHEIFQKYVKKIKAKEYRHNETDERERIVAEIEAAWSQVESMSGSLDVSIDSPTTQSSLNRIQNEAVDGYDLFILEAMSGNGVCQIITDDGDFSTVPGIQVYTANRNLINAARSQGKLLTR